MHYFFYPEKKSYFRKLAFKLGVRNKDECNIVTFLLFLLFNPKNSGQLTGKLRQDEELCFKLEIVVNLPPK